jgi:hypothetical protein
MPDAASADLTARTGNAQRTGVADLRVGSVVIDCRPAVDARLWEEALGYESKYPPDDDWALLQRPGGVG